jgi:hypothetical protein
MLHRAIATLRETLRPHLGLRGSWSLALDRTQWRIGATNARPRFALDAYASRRLGGFTSPGDYAAFKFPPPSRHDRWFESTHSDQQDHRRALVSSLRE